MTYSNGELVKRSRIRRYADRTRHKALMHLVAGVFVSHLGMAVLYAVGLAIVTRPPLHGAIQTARLVDSGLVGWFHGLAAVLMLAAMKWDRWRTDFCAIVSLAVWGWTAPAYTISALIRGLGSVSLVGPLLTWIVLCCSFAVATSWGLFDEEGDLV